MKKISFLLAAVFLGYVAQAQTKSKATNSIPRAEAVATVTVAKEATVVGFEKVISPGRLSLAKSYRKVDDGVALKLNYTLTLGADASFNNRKPVNIGLSRKSFDSVFTRGSAEMAAKYPVLNKYVTDHNISLTDEQGWVAVIKYFNTL